MNHHAERLIEPDGSSIRSIDMEHADVDAAIGKVHEPSTRERAPKALTGIIGINGDHVNLTERRIVGVRRMKFRPAERIWRPFDRMQ